MYIIQTGKGHTFMIMSLCFAEVLGSSTNIDSTVQGDMIEDANTMFFVGTEVSC